MSWEDEVRAKCNATLLSLVQDVHKPGSDETYTHAFHSHFVQHSTSFGKDDRFSIASEQHPSDDSGLRKADMIIKYRGVSIIQQRVNGVWRTAVITEMKKPGTGHNKLFDQGKNAADWALSKSDGEPQQPFVYLVLLVGTAYRYCRVNKDGVMEPIDNEGEDLTDGYIDLTELGGTQKNQDMWEFMYKHLPTHIHKDQ